VLRLARRLTIASLACAFALPLGGCAGALSRVIVDTRNAQGDSAYASGSLSDALVAYTLALNLDPSDARARMGCATVDLRIAEKQFHTSKFDEALTTLGNAAKYDPQSVRLAELRSEVEQARVKREIVLSNYPAYRESGAGIVRSYENFEKSNKTIVAALGRFGYTYDSNELTTAIRTSVTLSDELKRLTGRLTTFRQAIEAGSPGRSGAQPLSADGSLLPLP